MHLISDDLLSKYRALPSDRILSSIELGVMRAFDQMGTPSIIHCDGDSIEVTLVTRNNDFQQVDINRLGRRVKRLIKNSIELELMEQETYQEWSSRYRKLIGTVQTGTIERIDAETGSLSVAITLSDYFGEEMLLCECPVRQQTPHERGHRKIGDVNEYLITSGSAVTDGRRRAYNKLVVSRVALDLPAVLLARASGAHLPGIRCVERRLGLYTRKSVIVSRHAIPRAAVIAVGKELKEHLEIINYIPGFKTRRA